MTGDQTVGGVKTFNDKVVMKNAVLLTQSSGTAPITATTELGVKAFSNSGNNRGFEFRLTATQITQVVTNGAALYTRHTSDNGATWTAWGIGLDTLNTGWV